MVPLDPAPPQTTPNLRLGVAVAVDGTRFAIGQKLTDKQQHTQITGQPGSGTGANAIDMAGIMDRGEGLLVDLGAAQLGPDAVRVGPVTGDGLLARMAGDVRGLIVAKGAEGIDPLPATPAVDRFLARWTNPPLFSSPRP